MVASVRRLSSCVAAALVAAAVPACVKHDRDTQITVAITAETRIPDELNAVQVTVFAADGSLRYDRTYDVVASTFFPTTLAIVPSDDASLRGPVRIEVRGLFEGNDVRVFRRALVSYVEGRSLYVPMPLRMACFHLTACNESESCIGGTCRPASVDSKALAEYSDALVFDTAAGSACFDEQRCLADAQKVPVTDCTFALPAGAPTGADGRPQVNVAIEWQAAPSRIIALDEGDPVEGWTRDASGVGRLSPGVCTALTEAAGDTTVPDHALAAWVSTACAPKGKLQPYCRAPNGQLGVGREL